MLNKSIFFNNFFFKSKKFYQNLKKTKKIFNSFQLDLKNFEIPLLKCYEKDYAFDFSPATVKKFSKYKNIVVIGMGGSVLGTKSIYSFLKTKVKKEVFFFDNLDENLHLQFNKINILKNSCFIIVSKSGNTLETITNFSVIFSKSLFKNKLIFITEIKDNVLNNIAHKFNAEIIEHKDFIGGRYSVLSEVGMFPAALMGLNIHKFQNLKKLIVDKNFVSSLIQNVASMYTLNIQGVKSSVIFNYDSSLNDLSLWYQQLVAESLGKKGKGITPILSFGPKDHHSVLQLYLDGPKDKFFTFITTNHSNKGFVINKDIMTEEKVNYLVNKKMGDLMQAAQQATLDTLGQNSIKFREIHIPIIDTYSIGSLMALSIIETVAACVYFEVNPFNQPAVEQGKRLTKQYLRY